jgi:hypothetical protein
VPALVRQIDRQHGLLQPSLLARAELGHLEAGISESARRVSSGQPVTVTGRGFIPGQSPNGTAIEDGFGVFPPLPGQFGVTGPPFADPTSTVPGQTWDTVTATVTGSRHGSPAQPLTVTGPDGSGTVSATIDTSGLAAGTYTVTITGDVLTQAITFEVQHGRSR